MVGFIALIALIVFGFRALFNDGSWWWPIMIVMLWSTEIKVTLGDVIEHTKTEEVQKKVEKVKEKIARDTTLNHEFKEEQRHEMSKRNIDSVEFDPWGDW